MQNRRQFTRILFSMPAELAIGQHLFSVNIQDISLNGALLSLDTKGLTLKRELGLLSFQLDNSEAKIIMNVAIVHQEKNEIGVQCHGIDIDSISLLRRLIELNLADDEQFHKELSQLSRA
ncbi:PilZ domain-containing protein [Colwellia sp. BRX10-3]|uniref:PilZ domain-containing protein n=1 Tax=Colwellia sp. BRX10-3 TaxID=2759844 RepID=UPI0015F5D948|nr:PilZ domain-containing protein [Colwellia sp. BRX10-3]MBA6390332.1 PilZ domain-containing protein [Colwellia sp. BRX10-3]